MEDITPAGSVASVYLIEIDAKDIAQTVLQDEQREAAELAKVVAKEAAIAKLAKLGLTEEEITALIGA